MIIKGCRRGMTSVVGKTVAGADCDLSLHVASFPGKSEHSLTSGVGKLVAGADCDLSLHVEFPGRSEHALTSVVGESVAGADCDLSLQVAFPGRSEHDLRNFNLPGILPSRQVALPGRSKHDVTGGSVAREGSGTYESVLFVSLLREPVCSLLLDLRSCLATMLSKMDPSPFSFDLF